MLNLLLDAMGMGPFLALYSLPAILIIIFVFGLCITFLVMLIVFSNKKNKQEKINLDEKQNQDNKEEKFNN